jgi:ribosomal protein L11 methyltransferase
MGWLRLTVSTDAAHVEAIAEMLERFGAASISYVPLTKEPLFDEGEESGSLWRETGLIALLDESIDLDILLACLRNQVGAEHIRSHHVAPLQEEAWSDRHKAAHGPMVYGGRLCVCPSWCDPPAHVSAIIRLDPGLAFGTGSHPTTRLCLEWLAGAELSGARVIDYGCGSGVLGLAAAVLGAVAVQAVDKDAQALAAARANTAGNGLAGLIRVCRPEELESGADVLLANILLGPLLQLAERFAGLLAPGGRVVLSGLLAHQAEECLAAYQPWFKMEAPRFSNEWAVLCGSRR